MPEIGCPQAMELLNQVFTTAVILNDGHEILARLEAGDDLSEVVRDLGRKFGRDDGVTGDMVRVVNGWPSLHLELVGEVVQWALSKLDTAERIVISWQGDAEHDDTVTKFELRDHRLGIEFAHPPAAAGGGHSSSGGMPRGLSP